MSLNRRVEVPVFINRDPLKFLALLTEKGRPVFEIQYNPQLKLAPSGLGSWPHHPLSDIFLAQSNDWLKLPTTGEHLVAKIVSTPDSFDHRERVALIKLNQLFQQDANERHAILYGYGTHESTSQRTSYFILEKVPEGFISFWELKKAGWGKNPIDAFELCLAAASFLTNVHASGLTHGDLDGPGLEHYYWNPSLKQLRVIDWNRAMIRKYPLSDKNRSEFRDSLGEDHDGLWHLLYYGVFAGTTLDQIQNYAKDNFKKNVAEKYITLDNMHWRHGGKRLRRTASGTKLFRDHINAILEELRAG